MLSGGYIIQNLGGRENVDLVNSHPAFGKYRDCYVDSKFWSNGGFGLVVKEYLGRRGYEWFDGTVTDRDTLNSDPVARVALAIWRELDYRGMFDRPATKDEVRKFLEWFHPVWAEWAKDNRPGDLEECGSGFSTWATAAQLLDDEMDTL